MEAVGAVSRNDGEETTCKFSKDETRALYNKFYQIVKKIFLKIDDSSTGAGTADEIVDDSKAGSSSTTTRSSSKKRPRNQTARFHFEEGASRSFKKAKREKQKRLTAAEKHNVDVMKEIMWKNKKKKMLLAFEGLLSIDDSKAVIAYYKSGESGDDRNIDICESPSHMFSPFIEAVSDSNTYEAIRTVTNEEEKIYRAVYEASARGQLPNCRIISVPGLGNVLIAGRRFKKGEVICVYTGKYMFHRDAPPTHEAGGDCVVTLLEHKSDPMKDVVISPANGSATLAHFASSPSPTRSDWKNANAVPVIVKLTATDPKDNKEKLVTAMFLVCVEDIPIYDPITWFYQDKYFDAMSELTKNGKIDKVEWMSTNAQKNAIQKINSRRVTLDNIRAAY